MAMYIGIVELERFPFRDGILVNAENDEEAKKKYEAYCDKLGGYIFNLVRGTEKNKEKYSALIECCEKFGKEI